MVTVEPTAARPGRRAELWLLVLALALGVTAYAQVALRITETLPTQFWVHTVGLVVLAFGMHMLLRWRAPYADQVMLPIVVGLNGIGLAMIYRSDLGEQESGTDQAFANGQLGATALAMLVAATVIFLLRDHRTLRRYTYTAMVVGLILIALPLVPGLGQEINGARIWITIAGNSLQPAEFAKIALAVFFAGYLVTNRDTLALAGPKLMGLHLPRVRDLGPIILIWLASLAVLVFERDLGTSLLFFGLFVAMLYIATERISWVLIGMVLFGGGAILAATTFSHVSSRIDGWLHAFDTAVYDQGTSYQLVQGLFGMANGGLFGTGWGNGYPNLVPYAYSDFIYASLGEELGLTGLLAILIAYLILIERGLRTAVGVRDGFGKLLAGGLAFVMALQLFVVVGGITRIIPITGLTLPFVAHGGSSLLANWLVVGLLLRISDNARRPSALPVRGQVASGHPPVEQDVEEVDAVGEPDVAPPGPVRVSAADQTAGVPTAAGGPGRPAQIVRPTSRPESASEETAAIRPVDLDAEGRGGNAPGTGRPGTVPPAPPVPPPPPSGEPPTTTAPSPEVDPATSDRDTDPSTRDEGSDR
ncbi:cell division protein FtsW, lipid II flippase [Paraoerskovia marina]|uniref:Cell division protein FtsW, lipid II flippase n=1 Tax=Paraoerskovia marina TaxID=545619 RepID=A0A1H1N8N7_9CELL|nr:FtsW/RodA/SpoVE family cell cycle protein [Paraoerskovia marina]SDR95075.1 cell division protein FtsW, lipid II flippase [Paraoerskovia marina]